MTNGCFKTVGVAVGTLVLVGMLVGCAVSPGANGARVYGSMVGYGDGSRVTSEGPKVGSRVGDADGCSVGTSRALGSVVGNTEGSSIVGVGNVGTELGSDVGIGVGGLGVGVVGVTEG